MKSVNDQKMKLYILKRKYNDIYNILIKLQSHIDNLYNIAYIDYNDKKNILIKLYECCSELNTKYNEYINDNINGEELDLSLDDNINNYMYFYELNKYVDSNILNIINPMDNYIDLLKNIVRVYGGGSIYDTIEFMIGKLNLNILSDNVNNILKELDNIAICIEIDIINELIDDDYYFELPLEYDDNDYLRKKRYIIVKIDDNKYMKIGLLFKTDILSVNLKTCQLNLEYLYGKKEKIFEELKNDITEINNKFIKTYIKHDYLGNLYTLETNDYKNKILDDYNYFIELTNYNETKIMKLFFDDKINIHKKFNIIFLLLLGSQENCEMASILIGILREKKNQVKNMYELFYNNLSFYYQLKLQKSNITLKEEIENIKNISIDIDYSKQLALNKNIPENVKSLVMEKIEEMKTYNNDYFKQLTYVKNVLKYPWSSDNDLFYKNLSNSNAKDYINKIEKKLMKLSYGHIEAKKLLLQIIGKWISNPKSMGQCFSLVGPPGVGKTLLAKSVSKALDIPFAQITLGGQNDGELLHGHGYTYSGSQPGLIIKKMVEMGKQRCILFFDELDKACSKHGKTNEISSILIHLTDPNMNTSFQDRFFQGIEFPLDKVIMIFSYNDSNLVDPILLDRIKEINVDAYSINEKVEIVQKYMLKELLENIGLENDNIKISKKMIEYIIENYTMEAGVRNIKRKLEEILMNLNLDKLYKRELFEKDSKSINITKSYINKILKEPDDDTTYIHKESVVGIINGMYATKSGSGGIIPIQIFKNVSISDNFEFKLTGKQGDVMKESVKCSYTAAVQYIERNKEKYGIENLSEYLKENYSHGFHIHCPDGATPKDGPSAGCAFTSCFISRILKKKIRNDISMTGEIDLTGKIKKIGGLNFKLLGAKKAGVKYVFVPKENANDLEEIKEKYPKLLDKKFKVEICDYIDDIIDKILI